MKASSTAIAIGRLQWPRHYSDSQTVATDVAAESAAVAVAAVAVVDDAFDCTED